MQDTPPHDDEARGGADENGSAGSGLTRRRLLGSMALAATLGTGGCLTLSPSVRSSGVSGSDVFETVSAGEPWASGRVTTSVTLTPAASTDMGVRGLTVVASDGTSFDTADVDSGQTSVTLFLPVGNSTLTAVDYDGATVDRIRVSVGGDRLF